MDFHYDVHVRAHQPQTDATAGNQDIDVQADPLIQASGNRGDFSATPKGNSNV